MHGGMVQGTSFLEGSDVIPVKNLMYAWEIIFLNLWSSFLLNNKEGFQYSFEVCVARVTGPCRMSPVWMSCLYTAWLLLKPYGHMIILESRWLQSDNLLDGVSFFPLLPILISASGLMPGVHKCVMVT